MCVFLAWRCCCAGAGIEWAPLAAGWGCETLFHSSSPSSASSQSESSTRARIAQPDTHTHRCVSRNLMKQYLKIPSHTTPVSCSHCDWILVAVPPSSAVWYPREWSYCGAGGPPVETHTPNSVLSNHIYWIFTIYLIFYWQYKINQHCEHCTLFELFLFDVSSRLCWWTSFRLCACADIVLKFDSFLWISSFKLPVSVNLFKMIQWIISVKRVHRNICGASDQF